MLFIREFLAREKDQIAAAAHLEEVKKRNAQQLAADQERHERQLAADQERYERQLAADREYYDRMMERSEAMFQQVLQQAAADRQAFLDAINRLTDDRRRPRRSNLRNGSSANPNRHD